MKNLYYLFTLSFLLISCEEEVPPVTYTLTTQVTPTGSGTLNPSSGTYDEGESITISATPSANYSFKRWTGTGSGTANPLTFKIISNANITAEFELLDSDKDGITDALDKCPDTPAGTAVNAEGCATSQLDTDGDGVTDDIDSCPDTPNGEVVDSNGCSNSQKDTDGDGVTDDNDTCPDTLTGEVVDANGCSDSQKDTDNDGVTDDLDICLETPDGEIADINGCSDSQKDTDNDGVTDDNDLCPNSNTGGVNQYGCYFNLLEEVNEITASNAYFGNTRYSADNWNQIVPFQPILNEMGFIWGNNDSLSLESQNYIGLKTTGYRVNLSTKLFQGKVPNLDAGTLYYIRMFFKIGEKTYYTNIKSFSTLQLNQSIQGYYYETVKFERGIRPDYHIPQNLNSKIEILMDNLRVKQYNNGDDILFAPSDSEWRNAAENQIGAWCYVNNDPSTEEEHGLLYNDYVISDSRGIAPDGWRVTTSNDWEAIMAYMSAMFQNYTRYHVHENYACGIPEINVHYTYDLRAQPYNNNLINLKNSGYRVYNNANPTGTHYYYGFHNCFGNSGGFNRFWTSTFYNGGTILGDNSAGEIVYYDFRFLKSQEDYSPKAERINRGNGFSIRLSRDY